MSDLLKVVIAVGGALVLGLVIGLVVGYSGKGDLAAVAKAAKQRAETTELTLKEERADCQGKVAKAQLGRQLLLTKAALLRALVELQANNYGLASQHLATARSLVVAARKRIAKKHRPRLKQIYEQMASTQTLVMRLDPMARKYLQDLLAALQSIPGAR